MSLLWAAPTFGEPFTVTSNSDASDGACDMGVCDTLRAAIDAANATMGVADTITFSSGFTITLQADLPAITDDLTIDGASTVTVDGDEAHRVFFVESGTVNLTDLTILDGLAQGGAGGSRAGGGLGAGGGVFVNTDANVTLDGVRFTNNRAIGGDGGAAGTSAGGGGGGGLGGNGGAPSAEGAGGGGGGAFGGENGEDALLDVGGAGGGTAPNAGGAGGDAGTPGVDGEDGGNFGGGGGGGDTGGNGGAGGFGGGGGGGATDGTGGMGGPVETGVPGGGDGVATGQGGGGSAYGGAVFVREGGTLVLRDAVFFPSPGICIQNQDCVVAGTGGTDGQAAGSQLWLGTGVSPTDLTQIDVDTVPETRLTGSVSGPGGIEKTGPGDLVLMPADGTRNDYSGGTTIQEGRIVASSAGISGTVNVATGAELTLNVGLDTSSGQPTTNPGTETFVVDVQGAGALAKEGIGTAILQGTVNVGETRVRDGTLQGDTDALKGTITFPDDAKTGAALVFDQPSLGTFDGEVSSDPTNSGSFTVTKQGAGELMLTGRFTHEGTTDVSAGTLRLVDRGGESNITGNVGVGSGATLTGDGRVEGDVNVRSGGTFTGIGQADGNLIVRQNGTAAPGTSDTDDMSALSVGSADFRDGSFLRVNATANPGMGLSSRLDVGGSALIASGATLRLNLLGDSLPSVGDSSSFSVLDFGTLSGSFGTISGVPFVFDRQLAPMGNSLMLTLTRNDLTLVDVAGTPNEAAVATALVDAQQPPGNSSADLDDVISQLETLELDQIGPALDLLSGEGISSFTTPRILNADKVARTTMSRLGHVGGRALGSPGTIELARRMGDASQAAAWLFADTNDAGPIRVLAAAPEVSMPPPAEQQRWGVWLDGYGLFGDVDGDSNSASTDWNVAGVLGGLDLRLGQHALLGLGGGYASLDSSVNARRFDGDANVYQALLYAGYVRERFYIGAMGRYAYDDFSSTRRIVFASIDRRARGDFHGNEAGGYVETGVVAWDPGGVQLEPMASFHYTWLERSSFTEKGANSVDLQVKGDSWNSLLGTLGLRLHKSFQMEDELSFTPEVWVRYAHQFGDRDRPVDARFTGATMGGQFRVTGAEVGREGAILGVGWSVRAGKRLSAFLYYDATLNQDLLGNALAGGFLVRW